MNKSKVIKINATDWYIRLTWAEIVQKSLIDSISNNVIKNKNYIVQLKVRHDINQYFMLGKQIVFGYHCLQDSQDFCFIIESRLLSKLEQYNLDTIDLDYILLKFTVVNEYILSDILYDKEKLGRNNYELLLKTIKIPISKNQDMLGEPLLTSNTDNVKKLIVPKPYNDIVIENKIYDDLSTNKTKMYFREGKPATILSVTDISSNIKEKSLLTISGNNIVTVKDTYNENSIERRENSISKTFNVDNNNEIVSFHKILDFKNIENKIFKSIYHPSLLIGVIDLETYFDSDSNTSKVYAAGFKTYLSTHCYIEYIDKNINNNIIIINLVNEILRPKYENIKFYIHNLGGYDSIFILKALYEHNKYNQDKFIIETLFSNNRIIKLTIKKRYNNNIRKVTIIDSYAILNSSLRDLGTKYSVDTVKGYFPYKFVQPNTLFYIGKTPEMEIYEGISKENYNCLVSNSWNLKQETIKYLEGDLNSLYEILRKFSKYIYKLFQVDFTESLTISSLSLNIFLKKYYDKEINAIPNIKKMSVYTDIKQSYYGGITEVYIPKGYNLYYYDVNSLYPFVAKNAMIGSEAKYIEYIKHETFTDEMFGFYYVEVDNEHSNLYIGLLPYRDNDGLYFPIGKWKGWYFSEELKFAIANGYKIKVLKGYSFEKKYNIFDKYVDDIYYIKSNPKDSTEKALAKSLLNNLLGRFGMDIDKPITKIVNKKEYDKILITSPLISEAKITDDAYLVTYTPVLDKSIAEKLNIDTNKAYEKYNHLNEVEPNKAANKYVSIGISSAITSYGRIHISKLKLDILNKGGKIYYSDTDSIVTDIVLDSSLVSPNVLGKLKMEHEISEGYFISNKTYAFITNQGLIIKKSKGLDSNLLSYQDYIDMYNEKNIETKVRKESIKNYSDGSVNIKDRNIILNPLSYKKREKIYKNGVWIGTRPIKI